VSHANGYAVAFYRGDRVAFSARTARASLDVKIAPGGLTDGRTGLRPGAYRWYVWPLRADGTRAATAVVQAEVVVSRD
jgi:hypothetical protein